jgi:glycine/D-amino acid oxidase-like deaminating enzyme
MGEIEVLVVGQGLAGTWLSWWLHHSGISFKVLDRPDPDSASKRAAGLINPVTGRRLVKTWMIEEIMPFAVNSYRQFGGLMDETFLEETSVIDFFPTVQMLQSFQKRFDEDPTYLASGNDPLKYTEWFRYDLGWGAVQPSYVVRVEKLLNSWNGWLKKRNLIMESVFDRAKLQIRKNGIDYEGMSARHIIFCDGKTSSQNPEFGNLPFALNKGEGLLVEIKGLPPGLVFKKGLTLVPYREDIFWLGSSYEWEFSDDRPSDLFRKNAESWLRQFLKLPFEIREHFAAIRPATLERRPFAGFHPVHTQIGILNGLGTKGCSLAPYFGWQLVQTLKGTGDIHPLADIGRFEKILSRPF